MVSCILDFLLSGCNSKSFDCLWVVVLQGFSAEPFFVFLLVLHILRHNLVLFHDFNYHLVPWHKPSFISQAPDLHIQLLSNISDVPVHLRLPIVSKEQNAFTPSFAACSVLSTLGRSATVTWLLKAETDNFLKFFFLTSCIQLNSKLRQFYLLNISQVYSYLYPNSYFLGQAAIIQLPPN